MASASANVREVKEVVRRLVDDASMVVWETDPQGRCIYLNPAAMESLSCAQQMSLADCLRFIHPEDLPRVSRALAEAGKSLREYRLECRVIRSDGTTRSVVGAASPRFDSDGCFKGYLGMMVDVSRPDTTAQRQAERELARREERFHSLASLSSDWYWETDDQLRFTFCSEGVHARLGLPPEQLLGAAFHCNATDPCEPGLVAVLEHMAARRPFRDIVYPVWSAPCPQAALQAIRFLRISGEPVSEDSVFKGYRGVAHDVTREVEAAREMERLATLDGLTELPNRASLDARLMQRLAGADRPGPRTSCAVFLIDLDDFKEVNDSLGHRAGDLVLKDIAIRLRECVHPDDMLARLGGDEFVVVAECRGGKPSAMAIADTLCEELARPIEIEGHEVMPGISIGISLYPQHGDNSRLLLKNADTALCRAKADGGRRYCFYMPEAGGADRARLPLQSALRHALERNEFEVHYQPRIDLKTFEMTGMEALLRWTHPELGSIPPAQFIPLAEQIGLIDDIGEWVLRRAAVQAHEWTVRYKRPLRISVNLSARQLRNKRLIASVAHALRLSGLAADQLELELTESALMENPERAASMLHGLKALGLHFSVDDFGTGYSSLSYLCRFPLDTLKLDRTFLAQQDSHDIGPRCLAKAIINMAHTLNLAVVAEGVETEDHLSFLEKTLCDGIQGFLFSEPLIAKDFERLLQWPGWPNWPGAARKQEAAGSARGCL